MMSQPMAKENIVILTANGIDLAQADESKSANQSQGSLRKHLQAEVKVFGTIQIVCGAMVLSLGILLQSAPFSPHFTHVFSTLLKAAYPFIGGLCFVISGSLSIITEKKSTKPLVQSSLAANFLSSLSALVGFILLSVNLALLGPALQKCDLDKEKLLSEWQTSNHNFYQNEMNCLIANDTLASVLFQPLSDKDKSGIVAEANFGCGYEKLSNS
ncbi:membrane-spanning 4-domains subfamily A member 6A isoform X2 [Rousettus aegyptiacus]|uniref:membrane-spanning 4-domains subfamily A member 6A isoform X2 n=1 Tax=Rousettus aegyptiacus TaxID=9407 RepID=UPI00168D1C9A|nr:membrane-spanning 4-domains subfamily A member 6A isoform X2 [Rousettus aegyptiacus]